MKSNAPDNDPQQQPDPDQQPQQDQQHNAREQDKELSRKQFLTAFSLSIAGLSAIVMAVPVVSALVAPLIEHSPSRWRALGHVDDFPIGSTQLVTFDNADAEAYAGMLARSAAWLRHNENRTFTAFAINCTHLGCPVRWEEKAGLFMCPCHGGVYFRNGTVAAGPPPKPLPEYKVRIVNGEVQLLTAPLPITSV